jgi:hypothetical protein
MSGFPDSQRPKFLNFNEGADKEVKNRYWPKYKEACQARGLPEAGKEEEKFWSEFQRTGDDFRLAVSD